MSTPTWHGPVEWCKACGKQKHPDRPCNSNKCMKLVWTQEEIDKAKADAKKLYEILKEES